MRRFVIDPGWIAEQPDIAFENAANDESELRI